MAKLKPISRFERDVRQGDLVRVFLKDGNVVGYFDRCWNRTVPVYLVGKYKGLRIHKTNRDGSQIWKEVERYAKLYPESPIGTFESHVSLWEDNPGDYLAHSYEVLRRAPKRGGKNET